MASTPSSPECAGFEAPRAHPPWQAALLIQLAAFAIALVVAVSWARLGRPPPLVFWALFQGACASLLAWRLGRERWWLAIHLLFAPALALLLFLDLPSWLFLAGFLLSYLLHGATYRTRVPTHLSRKEVIAAVADLLPARPGLRCVDLGCGFGGVLNALARRRGDGEYRGIKRAILPFAVSWLRSRHGAYRVRWGDFWQENLNAYDVAYAYLSPAAMPGLWAKARREMKPGSLLISNGFAVPGVAPTRIVATRGGAPIYLWRIGEGKC